MDAEKLWNEFSKTGSIKKYLEYVQAGKGENRIETVKGKVEDAGTGNKGE